MFSHLLESGAPPSRPLQPISKEILFVAVEAQRHAKGLELMTVLSGRPARSFFSLSSKAPPTVRFILHLYPRKPHYAQRSPAQTRREKQHALIKHRGLKTNPAENLLCGCWCTRILPFGGDTNQTHDARANSVLPLAESHHACDTLILKSNPDGHGETRPSGSNPSRIEFVGVRGILNRERNCVPCCCAQKNRWCSFSHRKREHRTSHKPRSHGGSAQAQTRDVHTYIQKTKNSPPYF